MLKRYSVPFALLLALTVLRAHAWAALTDMNVTAVGTGMTQEGATTDALVHAINQVNGRVIDEHVLGISLDAGFKTVTTGSQAPSSSQSASTQATTPVATSVQLAGGGYAKFIDEETHGAVKSFKILKQSKDASGMWTVTVSATIAKFKAPAEAMRRRLAILPLTSEHSSFSVDGRSLTSESVTQLLDQSVTDSLTSTHKFAVLDRQHNPEINAELSAIQNHETSVDDFALLGQRLVADYVLVGSVDGFSYKTLVTHFPGTDRTIERHVGNFSLGYRLIDPVTSQVVLSGTISEDVSSPTLSHYGSLDSPNAVGEALASYAGERLTKSIADALYPILIVDASGNDVVIAEGANALRTGETYRVYRYGKIIKDPYTGESLGPEEFYCCSVKVTRVTPNLAYGAITGLKGDFASQFRPNTFVLRDESRTSHTRAAAAQSKNVNKLIQKQNAALNGGPP